MSAKTIHVAPPAPLGLREALALAPTALARIRETDAPALATAIVTGDGIVLGALERRTDEPALRRLTTGPRATVRGEVLFHVLALPSAQALAPDGHAGNLLNRNLRGFLAGYARTGVRAHYFGREHIAFDRRPGAMLGYDVDAEGRVVVEVVTGLDSPVCAGGVGLREVMRKPRAAEEIAELVHRGLLSFWDRVGSIFECSPSSSPPPEPAAPTDPIAWHGRDVPIGRVEAAIDGRRRAYLRGSLLTARHAVLAIEDVATAHLARGRPLDDAVLAPLAGLPVEGARPSDLLAVLNEAASGGPA